MKINSYLMFNGNCEAAFKFYEQCLGGKITMMMAHKEAPSAETVSPEWQDKIMHACLELDDCLLMGSDCPPGYFETPQGFYVQRTQWRKLCKRKCICRNRIAQKGRCTACLRAKVSLDHCLGCIGDGHDRILVAGI
ncbi:hypothetical protein [Myxacorys almedinensis]|uniref:hypothetical protein n=1 Tax=Myxacorys almedinensis TaxID=2651157 RepID=UPI001EE4B1B4|nr:hypothetical protein [Myxacorys almedinensis]